MLRSSSGCSTLLRLSVRSIKAAYPNPQVEMSSNAAATTSAKQLEPSKEQIERVTGKIAGVRQRIQQAARDAKRREEVSRCSVGGLVRGRWCAHYLCSPCQNQPRLVAISKLHPPTSILAAHLHSKPGQLHFGENYAQELEAKASVLPASILWHFVGKLQSNKAKLIAAIPNLYLLETLDSIKLATALDKARTAQADKGQPERLRVYLQINTSGEENKSGLPPLQSGQNVEAWELTKLAMHVITDCNALHLRGLMTIGAAENSTANKERAGGPADEEQSSEQIAAEARSLNPDFDTLYRTRQALVAGLRARLDKDDKLKEKREQYADLLGRSDDETGGLELSMGMSNDLEVAVRAGSDNVRVGTDCFGTRPPSRDEAMEAMKDELQSQ